MSTVTASPAPAVDDPSARIGELRLADRRGGENSADHYEYRD